MLTLSNSMHAIATIDATYIFLMHHMVNVALECVVCYIKPGHGSMKINMLASNILLSNIKIFYVNIKILYVTLIFCHQLHNGNMFILYVITYRVVCKTALDAPHSAGDTSL